MHNGLNALEIKEVQQQAKSKLGVCYKQNVIIGTQIFHILKQYARVIYYPFGKNAPWGFTRINGSKNDSDSERPFVAINTSIPIPCQVFAAAHELYHIWYEQHPDLLPANLLDENIKELNEKKANRFAAEFLMDELLLKKEIQFYGIEEITIKEILQLAELFMVPYKSMVKRLYEIDIIKKDKAVNLFKESDESVNRYRKRYSFSESEANNKIAVDNLVELAVDAYDKSLVTFEKLEYLLGICGLNPSDLGITKKIKQPFPSDGELDKIMEGE